MRIVAGLLGLSFVLAANGPDGGISRAASYLWSQQSKDGGWHSRTYGLLRSGQSLTPFVLEALLQVPPEIHKPPPGALQRALAFLERNTTRDGAVGLSDPLVPDYPNYATALTVQVLCRWKPPGYEKRIAPMVAYLRQQQLVETNGWSKEDAPYGGWGIGGEQRKAPHPGHVDLSMTRYVLQALLMAGVPQSDPAFAQARVFVERCQNFDPADPANGDGGFFFSTVVLDANKAGQDGSRKYRSYGTTTADGILALRALGISTDHPRLRAAERWLDKNHIPAGAPGFVGEPYQRWKAGLRFYYASASAEAFANSRAAEMVPDLLRLQRKDGSWSNPEDLVKEDDPLIATTFALRTMLISRTLR